MKKQCAVQPVPKQAQKKNQTQPKSTLRLVLLCILGIYAILVLLLCGYAASLHRPTTTIVSNSSGQIIPPPPLTGDIDLNTADQKTLRLLPGIGEKLSQSILDYRKEYGRFHFAEDILYVHGIGEQRLENIRPFITISETP